MSLDWLWTCRDWLWTSKKSGAKTGLQKLDIARDVLKMGVTHVFVLWILGHNHSAPLSPLAPAICVVSKHATTKKSI